MKPLNLTFNDHLVLRSALELRGGDKPRMNTRKGKMDASQWRSWKKLANHGLGYITPAGGEAERFVLGRKGREIARVAKEQGAMHTALNQEAARTTARHLAQGQRRGARVKNLDYLAMLADIKKSVVFAKWNVGCRPAAMVMSMQARFVFKHLKSGIYTYLKP